MEGTSRGQFKIISRYLIGATEKTMIYIYIYIYKSKNSLLCGARLQIWKSGPRIMSLGFIPYHNNQNDPKTGLNLT
jgi:hypothetical protein